jgi:GlpG protein
MRKIGDLPNESMARVFSAALYSRGLENDVETEDNGAFSIWIHDDDQLGKGRELLSQYRERPDDPAWLQEVSAAARKRKQEEREAEKRGSNVVTRERMEYERNYSGGFAWFPMLLAIASIAATIWAGELGMMPSGMAPSKGTTPTSAEAEAEQQRQKNFEQLSITKVRSWQAIQTDPEFQKDVMESDGELTRAVSRHFYDASLPEIRSGEVWRLFTPMFIHFGLIHLVFNLLWLRDLGSFIQNRFGVAYLAVLVLTIAAISNLAQLLWANSPFFGGLSGVNYGLLGFLWMRSKFDRTSLWRLNPQIIQWMMVWFFLCFTPLIPNIANGAHAGGLLFGMLAGWATAQIANARRRRI